mgnify:CR=1 FL=1
MNFSEGAVDEDESLAAFEGALGGDRLSGTSAGADDHDAEVFDIDQKVFVDGADESWPVGVKAEGVVAVEKDGVDGAEGSGVGVNFRAGVECFKFVWNGDVDADEVEFAEFLECRADISGLHLEADVAHACTSGVEGGLMQLGGEGVGDWVAEDGDPGGLIRARVEVGSADEVFQGVDVFHASWSVAMVCSIRRMDSSRPRMERMSPRSGPPVLPLRATRRGNMSFPGLRPSASAEVAMASLGEVQSGRARKFSARTVRSFGAASLPESFSRAGGSNSTPSPR